MHPIVQEFEASRKKTEEYDFRPGDTVRVSVRIVEGGKERIQDFEGVCINRNRGGLGESFTVRRISYGVGMERVFPLHSPRIENIRVVRRGKVRRASLNYLRALRGKKARIAEDLERARVDAQKARQAGRKRGRAAAPASEEVQPVAAETVEGGAGGETETSE